MALVTAAAQIAGPTVASYIFQAGGAAVAQWGGEALSTFLNSGNAPQILANVLNRIRGISAKATEVAPTVARAAALSFAAYPELADALEYYAGRPAFRKPRMKEIQQQREGWWSDGVQWMKQYLAQNGDMVFTDVDGVAKLVTYAGQKTMSRITDAVGITVDDSGVADERMVHSFLEVDATLQQLNRVIRLPGGDDASWRGLVEPPWYGEWKTRGLSKHRQGLEWWIEETEKTLRGTMNTIDQDQLGSISTRQHAHELITRALVLLDRLLGQALRCKHSREVTRLLAEDSIHAQLRTLEPDGRLIGSAEGDLHRALNLENLRFTYRNSLEVISTHMKDVLARLSMRVPDHKLAGLESYTIATHRMTLYEIRQQAHAVVARFPEHLIELMEAIAHVTPGSDGRDAISPADIRQMEFMFQWLGTSDFYYSGLLEVKSRAFEQGAVVPAVWLQDWRLPTHAATVSTQGTQRHPSTRAPPSAPERSSPHHRPSPPPAHHHVRAALLAGRRQPRHSVHHRFAATCGITIPADRDERTERTWSIATWPCARVCPRIWDRAWTYAHTACPTRWDWPCCGCCFWL